MRASPRPDPAMDARQVIEKAFDARATLAAGKAPRELSAAIDECLELLGSGRARVAEPAGSFGADHDCAH